MGTENDQSVRTMEMGPELGPAPGRPNTIEELIEMAEHQPEALSYYFSEEDIRALFPEQPEMAERIISRGHGGYNAA